jgi:hypothetical protein
MLLPAPLLYPRRRKTRAHQGTTSPPAPLTLVAATYEAGLTLTLTFDRAVDVSAFDGAAVIVDDALETGLRYDGTGGAALAGPASIVVTLVALGDPTGTAVTLDASAANGIVAADDGGVWEGAAGLSLPFP